MFFLSQSFQLSRHSGFYLIVQTLMTFSYIFAQLVKGIHQHNTVSFAVMRLGFKFLLCLLVSELGQALSLLRSSSVNGDNISCCRPWVLANPLSH